MKETKTLPRARYVPGEHSTSRLLVPTKLAPTWPHDFGRYDSSARLPNIDVLFDRTLNQIMSAHRSRKRSSQSFDELWKDTCKTLKKKENASAYASFKQKKMIKNSKYLQSLDEKITAALATFETIEKYGQTWSVRTNDEEIETLKIDRKNAKETLDSSIRNFLQISIAFWIEARNAHNDGDEFRALHALIECHFFLGIAHSPKTESEAKSDAGKKSGKKERDALANAILDVMETIQVDKCIRNEESLWEEIYGLLQKDSSHARSLDAYERLTRNNSKNSPAFRFSENLRKWVKGKDQPYPQLTERFKQLLNPPTYRATIKRNSRKASG